MIGARDKVILGNFNIDEQSVILNCLAYMNSEIFTKLKEKETEKRRQKMNYELSKKELEILAEAAENCDLKINYEHSGRAMLGEHCIAIKYQNDYELKKLCEFISENGSPKLAISIATRWRTDNLGKGYIRYNNF